MDAGGMSGFLPTAALVESLVHTAREVATMEELPFVQTRNVSSAVRRTKLLSSLFDEIRDAGGPLPPSSILCLTELLSVIRHSKCLIECLAEGSALWNLVQAEPIARKFHASARELARALDILPHSLIGLSGDVSEQVELLHKQAKRTEVFLDPRELRLRDELLQLMAMERSKAARDRKKMEEIMFSIGLRSAVDYQEEISRLENEARKQAGTGGIVAVSNINILISLVSSAGEVIRSPAVHHLRPLLSFPRGLNRSVSTPSSFNSMVFNVPDEFRCPITLDLMRDPVIVASGHTYDRSSIARWINSGHHTCPKSGQRLIHMALIPNYALRSLITQWGKENNVPSSFWDRDAGAGAGGSHGNSTTNADKVFDHLSATRAATETVRMTAEFLVGKLAMGSPEIQRQAAYELRLLAKTGMDNRRIIAEAGAIPFLITLLGSRDPRTQENAVTALLNLSIFDNNKVLIMAAGALDSIIEVLCSGAAMEARENAAATIFSLSMVDECKVTMGTRQAVITGLVDLLREGTARGKKDAVSALFNIAVYNANKARIVAAGAVTMLVELLTDDKAEITDDALAVLALLCSCPEGLKEMGERRGLVPLLVELMRFGSAKGKENSITLLLGLCRDGGEEMGRALLMNPRSVPVLQSLADNGSAKARRKADALLRLLNRCCSQAYTATSHVG
ncbi:Zinc finger RING/FYVE/PHD-type protein [Dioscorea alata]|uniref:Zinc finger RING/FYVE/PHD-type protein n=1 Tax=Dioscorea alata TaxID=55571 RepID=A0ACB7VFB1_DIOAL|nr:Zinc finger RING/FYVE/PHD-type protein [Dioscorea alata]